jgi:hypothetical protein
MQLIAQAREKAYAEGLASPGERNAASRWPPRPRPPPPSTLATRTAEMAAGLDDASRRPARSDRAGRQRSAASWPLHLLAR